MTNKERLEELKEWFNNDGEIHQFQIEWLIKQAEKVNKINEFCEHESDIYADLKMDEARHKVDRIFFNGKQRAFNNVANHIKNLEDI